MIHPSELRIGNYIYDEENLFSKITGFTPFDHSVRCDEVEGCEVLIDIYLPDGSVREDMICESNEINPIPLTPEILEKCGFVRSPAANSTYISITELKAEIHFEDFRGCLVCVLYCSTGSFIPHEIKHLHQLQNLYFALTNSELIIDL